MDMQNLFEFSQWLNYLGVLVLPISIQKSIDLKQYYWSAALGTLFLGNLLFSCLHIIIAMTGG